MEEKMSKPDPEMLKNLDMLLDMDLLEEEKNWQVIEEASEEGEEFFERASGEMEDSDES